MANVSVKGKFVQNHAQVQRKVKGCFPENANEKWNDSEPPRARKLRNCRQTTRS